MKYQLLYIVAILLLSSCNSNEEMFNAALLELKQKSNSTFVEDIEEFNSYPHRPNSDGGINKLNVADFLQDKIPHFLSSNEDFTEVYNYRWWMMSKHLRQWNDTVQNKDIWVFTEFYGWPGHGSMSGAIPCPAGHQFYDLRWMRTPEYLRSYIEFYMKGYASKHNQRENYAFHSHISRPESHHYSSWMIDGTEALLKVHPDNQWRDMMLPHLETHQKVWDEKFKISKSGTKTDGLYKILDLYDGMEFTISATMALIESDGAYSIYTKDDWKKYYLGWGPIDMMRKSPLNDEYPKAFAKGYPLMYLARPSINSYHYANMKSLSNLYAQKNNPETLEQDKAKSKEYLAKAESLQEKALEVLWNDEDKFFNSITAADNDAGVKDWEARVRESVGYTPWYFNMLPQNERKYDEAWDKLFSKDGFHNTKGMTTAEISHPLYNEHAYAWNGRGWPFQNSVINKAYANYLKNYKTECTPKDREQLYELVDKLVVLHGQERNIGEWYIPSSGESFGGVKDYFHSSFPDMIIEDLLGFTSSHKNEFSLQPLLPEDKWDFFYLGNILYHDHEIDIVWKRDWDTAESGNQSYLCIWVDGELVKTSKSLNKKLTIKLSK